MNAGFWHWFSFICFTGVVLFKRNPLIIFTISFVGIVSIIAFHGDAMEMSQHTQQAMMSLRSALLLSILQTYTTIGRHISLLHHDE